jgi:hypothetical protein
MHREKGKNMGHDDLWLLYNAFIIIDKIIARKPSFMSIPVQTPMQMILSGHQEYYIAKSQKRKTLLNICLVSYYYLYRSSYRI